MRCYNRLRQLLIAFGPTKPILRFCNIAVIFDNDLTLGVIKRPHKPIQSSNARILKNGKDIIKKVQ